MSVKERILVVGNISKEFDHVQAYLPDWDCTAICLKEEGSEILRPLPPDAKMILVYAHKKEANTISICGHLRESPETKNVPLLLVVSRYNIAQSYPVRRMGNSGFVIGPFTQKELQDKIKELCKPS